MLALRNKYPYGHRRVSLEGLTPGAHIHAIADVTGLQGALDGKAPIVHSHDDLYYTEAEIDALAATLAPLVHTHDDRYYTETELNAGQLDTRYYTEAEITTLFSTHAASGDHDGRYYTETEVDGLIATRALLFHSHQAIEYDNGVSLVPSVTASSDGSIKLLRESGELIQHLEGTATGTADNLGNIIANSAATFRITSAHSNATAVNTAVGNIGTNVNLSSDQVGQWFTYNPTTGVVTLTRDTVVLGLLVVQVTNTSAAASSFVQLMRTGGPIATAFCGGQTLGKSVGTHCVMNLAAGQQVWLESNAGAANTIGLAATWSGFSLIALEI